jgi:hypothetical protein
MIHRRALVSALAASAVMPILSPPVAFAFGETSRFTIAELHLGNGTTSRRRAWARLLAEVRDTTSVETRPVVADSIPVLRPEDRAIFEHPFLVCSGSEAFPLPSDEGLEQLSRYLAYGGFLLFDDTSGSTSSGFDTSVRRLARVLYPTRQMAPLPKAHSIYRAFFLIDRPLGRVARFDDLEGITVGGVRIEGDRRVDTTQSPFVLMRNDLSGALDRNELGRNAHPVVPGGETQRREAVKLGINLVMYSLTSNYKKDQVHVKELIERQRLPSSMFGPAR